MADGPVSVGTTPNGDEEPKLEKKEKHEAPPAKGLKGGQLPAVHNPIFELRDKQAEGVAHVYNAWMVSALGLEEAHPLRAMVGNNFEKGGYGSEIELPASRHKTSPSATQTFDLLQSMVYLHSFWPVLNAYRRYKGDSTEQVEKLHKDLEAALEKQDPEQLRKLLTEQAHANLSLGHLPADADCAEILAAVDVNALYKTKERDHSLTVHAKLNTLIDTTLIFDNYTGHDGDDDEVRKQAYQTLINQLHAAVRAGDVAQFADLITDNFDELVRTPATDGATPEVVDRTTTENALDQLLNINRQMSRYREAMHRRNLAAELRRTFDREIKERHQLRDKEGQALEKLQAMRETAYEAEELLTQLERVDGQYEAISAKLDAKADRHLKDLSVCYGVTSRDSVEQTRAEMASRRREQSKEALDKLRPRIEEESGIDNHAQILMMAQLVRENAAFAKKRWFVGDRKKKRLNKSQAELAAAMGEQLAGIRGITKDEPIVRARKTKGQSKAFQTDAGARSFEMVKEGDGIKPLSWEDFEPPASLEPGEEKMQGKASHPYRITVGVQGIGSWRAFDNPGLSRFGPWGVKAAGVSKVTLLVWEQAEIGEDKKPTGDTTVCFRVDADISRYEPEQLQRVAIAMINVARAMGMDEIDLSDIFRMEHWRKTSRLFHGKGGLKKRGYFDRALDMQAGAVIYAESLGMKVKHSIPPSHAAYVESARRKDRDGKTLQDRQMQRLRDGRPPVVLSSRDLNWTFSDDTVTPSEFADMSLNERKAKVCDEKISADNLAACLAQPALSPDEVKQVIKGVNADHKQSKGKPYFSADEIANLLNATGPDGELLLSSDKAAQIYFAHKESVSTGAGDNLPSEVHDLVKRLSTKAAANLFAGLSVNERKRLYHVAEIYGGRPGRSAVTSKDMDGADSSGIQIQAGYLNGLVLSGQAAEAFCLFDAEYQAAEAEFHKRMGKKWRGETGQSRAVKIFRAMSDEARKGLYEQIVARRGPSDSLYKQTSDILDELGDFDGLSTHAKARWLFNRMRGEGRLTRWFSSYLDKLKVEGGALVLKGENDADPDKPLFNADEFAYALAYLNALSNPVGVGVNETLTKDAKKVLARLEKLYVREREPAPGTKQHTLINLKEKYHALAHAKLRLEAAHQLEYKACKKAVEENAPLGLRLEPGVNAAETQYVEAWLSLAVFGEPPYDDNSRAVIKQVLELDADTSDADVDALADQAGDVLLKKAFASMPIDDKRMVISLMAVHCHINAGNTHRRDFGKSIEQRSQLITDLLADLPADELAELLEDSAYLAWHKSLQERYAAKPEDYLGHAEHAYFIRDILERRNTVMVGSRARLVVNKHLEPETVAGLVQATANSAKRRERFSKLMPPAKLHVPNREDWEVVRSWTPEQKAEDKRNARMYRKLSAAKRAYAAYVRAGAAGVPATNVYAKMLGALEHNIIENPDGSFSLDWTRDYAGLPDEYHEWVDMMRDEMYPDPVARIDQPPEKTAQDAVNEFIDDLHSYNERARAQEWLAQRDLAADVFMTLDTHDQMRLIYDKAAIQFDKIRDIHQAILNLARDNINHILDLLNGVEQPAEGNEVERVLADLGDDTAPAESFGDYAPLAKRIRQAMQRVPRDQLFAEDRRRLVQLHPAFRDALAQAEGDVRNYRQDYINMLLDMLPGASGSLAALLESFYTNDRTRKQAEDIDLELGEYIQLHPSDSHMLAQIMQAATQDERVALLSHIKSEAVLRDCMAAMWAKPSDLDRAQHTYIASLPTPEAQEAALAAALSEPDARFKAEVIARCERENNVSPAHLKAMYRGVGHIHAVQAATGEAKRLDAHATAEAVKEAATKAQEEVQARVYAALVPDPVHIDPDTSRVVDALFADLTDRQRADLIANMDDAFVAHIADEHGDISEEILDEIQDRHRTDRAQVLTNNPDDREAYKTALVDDREESRDYFEDSDPNFAGNLANYDPWVAMPYVLTGTLGSFDQPLAEVIASLEGEGFVADTPEAKCLEHLQAAAVIATRRHGEIEKRIGYLENAVPTVDDAKAEKAEAEKAHAEIEKRYDEVDDAYWLQRQLTRQLAAKRDDLARVEAAQARRQELIGDLVGYGMGRLDARQTAQKAELERQIAANEPAVVTLQGEVEQLEAQVSDARLDAITKARAALSGLLFSAETQVTLFGCVEKGFANKSGMHQAGVIERMAKYLNSFDAEDAAAREKAKELFLDLTFTAASDHPLDGAQLAKYRNLVLAKLDSAELRKDCLVGIGSADRGYLMANQAHQRTPDVAAIAELLASAENNDERVFLIGRTYKGLIGDNKAKQQVLAKAIATLEQAQVLELFTKQVKKDTYEPAPAGIADADKIDLLTMYDKAVILRAKYEAVDKVVNDPKASDDAKKKARKELTDMRDRITVNGDKDKKAELAKEDATLEKEVDALLKPKAAPKAEKKSGGPRP